MECLPESLAGRKYMMKRAKEILDAGRKYYRPTERVFEKEIKRRLDGWAQIKKERRSKAESEK